MSASLGLRILVADLVRRPGSSRPIELDEPLADLEVRACVVPPDAPVHVAVQLERIPEGLVVRGVVEASWTAECGRCLRPIDGRLAVGVDELYEQEPVEGETYQLEHDHIDLEPLVRDALLLELPPAPLCRPDCAGLCPECGIDRNEMSCSCRTDDLDPRWAALRSLDH